MWKVPLHLTPDGTACLLLPSRVLLSNQADEFQASWFRRFSVDAVWQLADHSFILFKGADCPGIVMKFRSAKPASVDAEIAYYTPKVERLDPRHASLLVSAEDRKILRLADLLTAAKEDRAYMFWKMPFWGTDRDRRLLDRLRRLPTLGKIAGKPEEGKPWTKGQGFKPWYREKYEANPEKYGEPEYRWWKDSALFLDAKSKGWSLLLFPEDCRSIGPEPHQFHRLPSPAVFSKPMVLVNQGCSRFAFADFDVLFQHALQSITGPKQDEDLLLFLAALLNSPLAFYYLFHTSANWGVEQRQGSPRRIIAVAIPFARRDKRSSRESRDCPSSRRTIAQAQSEMTVPEGLESYRRNVARTKAIRNVNEMVYEYFDLSKWERALVEDTYSIFETSARRRPH